MDTISSKCQNCGSELLFDAKTKTLVCKHCGSNFILPTQSDDAVIVRQYDSGFHPNQLHQSLKSYKCGGCGNTYYMTSEEKSKKCPNCGNSTCEEISEDALAADAMIPFKLTKEEAAEKFKEYLKTRKSIPKELRKLAENQKLTGVFVPVWNFSFNITASYNAMVTEPERGPDGAYYASHKPIFGDKFKRVKSYDQIACKNHDDALLELFDEDDYVDLIPFFPEYTYGYKIDKITKDIHDYYHQITRDAEQDYKRKIKREIVKGHKEVSNIQVEAAATDVFFNFAYVPVYVNTFTYHGKIYKTYISGTNGKVAGKHPKSLFSKFLTFFKTIAILGIVGALAYFFLR